MTQMCEYCGTDHEVSDTVFAITSHGFGHANKETKKFCSVECRTWWRRRESDQPGAWEQPASKGYQARLDRFRNDHDESAAQPGGMAASETATVEVEA